MAMVENMKQDRVFAKKIKVQPFEFNKEVASVFDDMLVRSVPLYTQNIKRQAQLTALYYQDKTRIYDLGCSHGNLGILILKQFKKKSFSMVGVDSSKPMIEKYSQRLKRYNNCSKNNYPENNAPEKFRAFTKKIEQIHLVCGLLEDIQIKNASVVLINLTLQFLDIKKRNDLMLKIYKGLNPGGILLLTEKIIHSSKLVNDLQIKFYEDFKIENGYSRLEISQKRDALDKVLVPDTIKTHQHRILNAGFTNFDIWLKWFNFASMIAIK